MLAEIALIDHSNVSLQLLAILELFFHTFVAWSMRPALVASLDTKMETI